MNRKNTPAMGGWYAIPVITAVLLLSACASTENMALKSAKQSYATAKADPTVTGRAGTCFERARGTRCP